MVLGAPALAAVDPTGTLGLVAVGLADGAKADFPAAFGVVFNNAKLVGGFGDFFTELTAVFVTAAAATAAADAATVTVVTSSTGIFSFSS